jgi:hypothetical protein
LLESIVSPVIAKEAPSLRRGFFSADLSESGAEAVDLRANVYFRAEKGPAKGRGKKNATLVGTIEYYSQVISVSFR